MTGARYFSGRGLRLGCMLALALTGAAAAREKAFEPVASGVRERTGREVRWEQDAAARAQSQAQVRALLARPLTLGAAVQAALLNNRQLQATFEEVGLSSADLRAARTLTNPQADLAIKFPDRPPSGTMLEWGIAQNFLEVLMLPLRARVARERLAATQLRVVEEVVKLVAEVKSAVFELQADAALLERLRGAQEAEGAARQFARQLYEAGNTPELILVREEAAAGQARLEVLLAEAEERAHREKLTRLLGVSGWRLAGELPEIPAGDPRVGDLEALALAHRPDLAAARAELESTVRALGLEKRFRFVGALDFGMAGEHDPDGTNLNGPSLRLELPLFNQGQARIARGEAQLRRAERKFEQLAIDLRSEVQELRDRLKSKREIAAAYREELLPHRRRALALVMLNYNAMLAGAFELFSGKREELEAERGWIAARRDYWITRAELERAVGGEWDGPVGMKLQH